MNISVEDLQAYYDRLNHHDWTFDYTDDGEVWRRGHAEHQTILGLAAKHPDFDQLFRAFSNHVWRQAEKPARPA